MCRRLASRRDERPRGLDEIGLGLPGGRARAVSPGARVHDGRAHGGTVPGDPVRRRTPEGVAAGTPSAVGDDEEERWAWLGRWSLPLGDVTDRHLQAFLEHVRTTARDGSVARKLATRVWATLTSGTPYEFRDLNGTPIDRHAATEQAANLAVPADVRRRTRSHVAAFRRGRLSG